MRGLNVHNGPNPLVEPAHRPLEFPLLGRLVVAEYLFPLDGGVVNPHGAIGGEDEGVSSQALVNHINLVPTLHRGKLGAFNQFPDVVYPSIAGGVDFNEI